MSRIATKLGPIVLARSNCCNQGCKELHHTAEATNEVRTRMLTMPTAERLATDAYSDHVNPQWVRLLRLLEMNLSYERCVGTELFTADGLRILDFLSGYCVHNMGHNHPAIVSALKAELEKSGPVMLQSNASELAGELAERLCRPGGRGALQGVFRQFRKRRCRNRDQVRASLHGARWSALQRPRLPWPDLWRTVPDER